jgi:EAL domain-containing protein (putative c-di-GMP-specific phosphodiesterase class I)
MSEERGGRPGRVLIVDDEVSVLRVLGRVLRGAGHDVVAESSGHAAMARLAEGTFDVVLSDLSMPGMNGIELLRAVREHDLDVPVVLMTGAPDLETAMRAIEHGALRYVVKPVDLPELRELVQYAVNMCHMARVKREALRLLGDADRFVGDRAGLNARFDHALATLWMAYQPIVSWSQREIYSYEALVRNDEPTLANPGNLLVAAEQLGRLHDLGRRIRGAVAATAAQADGTTFFVNLHTRDLLDEELFSPVAPLSRLAHHVVLEITERASLDEVGNAHAAVTRLRALGYRIALDDLGAGYAGLTSLAQLRPEVVTVDMSLVRGVDQDATRKTLIGTMVGLSKALGMVVVTEGVETAGERDALVELGCDLFQGYLFARPARQLPAVAW